MMPMLHRVEDGEDVDRFWRQVQSLLHQVAHEHLHTVPLVEFPSRLTVLETHGILEIINQNRAHAEFGTSNRERADAPAKVAQGPRPRRVAKHDLELESHSIDGPELRFHQRLGVSPGNRRQTASYFHLFPSRTESVRGGTIHGSADAINRASSDFLRHSAIPRGYPTPVGTGVVDAPISVLRFKFSTSIDSICI